MSLVAQSVFLCHPLWLLACHTLTYFGVEDRLGPGLHFALCGDWSGVGSAVGALHGSLVNGTSQEPRRLQVTYDDRPERNALFQGWCPRDGSWFDAPPGRILSFVCEFEGACDLACPFDRVCVEDTLQYGDRCFVYVREGAPYGAARSDCQGRFVGNLVQVDTAEKNRDVHEFVAGETIWIGLSEPNDCVSGWDDECEMWQWPDGSQLNYSNWDCEPHNETAHGLGLQTGYDCEPDNEFGIDEDAACMNHCEQIPYNLTPFVWEWYEVVLMAYLIFLLSLAVLTTCVEGLFVCCYQKRVKKKRDATAGLLEKRAIMNGPYNMRKWNNDFPFATCQWHQEPAREACLHSVFCPVARISDTQEAVLGLDSADAWLFWIHWAVGFLLGCSADAAMQFRSRGAGQDFQLRNQLTSLAVAVYSHSRRQQIRDLFGGDPTRFYFKDFFCWWCCTICTATQEARTIDAAAGLQSRCCCQLVRPEQVPARTWPRKCPRKWQEVKMVFWGLKMFLLGLYSSKYQEVKMAAPPVTVGAPVAVPPPMTAKEIEKAANVPGLWTPTAMLPQPTAPPTTFPRKYAL